MGHDGNTVTTERGLGLSSYALLEGEVPMLHPPRLSERARKMRERLAFGSGALSEILAVAPPELTALLVADEDWNDAPRETERPYPPGLPYFTRSADPPALVLPETLSVVFQPRTAATLPLTVWHELGHAFLLRREVVRTPVWFGEFLPQVAAATVARRAGLLEGHLARLDATTGFTVRSFGRRAGAGEQMAFQNLLLLLGAAALSDFGEGFVRRAFHALWEEDYIVDEEWAEALLAGSLGPSGREWLSSRPEFQGGQHA